jgi:hypothetical protein
MARRASRPRREPLVEIIVRRGALRRFDALTRKTSDLSVRVSWDRRTAREAQPPAGTPDRRTPLPFTWTAADFVVVEPALPSGSADDDPAQD